MRYKLLKQNKKLQKIFKEKAKFFIGKCKQTWKLWFPMPELLVSVIFIIAEKYFKQEKM